MKKYASIEVKAEQYKNLAPRYQKVIRALLPSGRFFGHLQTLKKVLFLTIAHEFARYHLLCENLQKGVLLENDFLLKEYQRLLQREYPLILIKNIFTKQLFFSQSNLQNLVGEYYSNVSLAIGKVNPMHAKSPCTASLGYFMNQHLLVIHASGLKAGKTETQLREVLLEICHAYATIILNGKNIKEAA